MQEIKIGDRQVGPGAPPYVIAEAGVHHENDVGLAKKYIHAAAEAGADAIKFQTYSADRLAAKWAPTYWDDGTGQTQYDIFSKRSLLQQSDYQELVAFAAEQKIHFLSTPFDETSAAMLADLGMPAFKIASADLTHHPLLRSVAAYGRPVLMSTGAAAFDEIEEAVKVVRSEGAPVAILHCNLSYPTPVEEANLGRIALLRERFPEVALGYSDHTRAVDTELACPLAVGLGACFVEKHFTLDPSLPGDDHYHSVDPHGLRRLVSQCRDAWRMTVPALENTPSEQEAKRYARRSVVAARKLKADTRIGLEDLDFKRPGTGVPPSRVEALLGRVLKRPIEADDQINEEDLE